MFRSGAALLRRLRARASRWSPSADRDFHDALFATQQYDPFTFAYPGYITIRRFADLASARLDGLRLAVDFGCGPGEITCELARRHPAVRFAGVDHSRAAIDRARANAARLGVTNATFDVGDVEHPVSHTAGADIVLMFDAFHHLVNPEAFVRACGVDRMLLIEPAGTWIGGWQRTLDLDWIPSALDDIRKRLLWDAGMPDPAPDRTETAAANEGRAVEHRYPIDDFVRFFDGYGLDVRGTVAGFDRYPSNPYGAPPMREAIGRAMYETLVAIEEGLHACHLDLHAKHWAIYAERGAGHRLRAPAPLTRTGEPPPLAGSHDVEYLSLDAPAATRGDEVVPCTLTFRNRSWRTWRSDGDAPVFASYHWLDRSGAVVVQDGLRTPLPRPVEPGGECRMTLRVQTPDTGGRYTLAVDLVEEGVAWFGDAGAPMLRRDMTVSPPSRR